MASRRRLISQIAVAAAIVVGATVAIVVLGHRNSSSTSASTSSTAADPAATSTTTGGATSGATTSTTLSLAARDYSPGDCVTWDQSASAMPEQSTKVVSCDSAHLAEVMGIATAPDSAASPTPDQWHAIFQSVCYPLATKYLGYPLLADGRFYASGITPTAEGWDQGIRYFYCTLGEVVPPGYPAGQDYPFAGKVKGQSQT
jgi:hypothetical protein